MSLIPISRIFRNVLWLIEQEENVAKDDCLGVWDLNKKTRIPAQICYIDLVQGLGFDYFDCSLYENIKGKVNLSNMIDGKLRFISPDVLLSKKDDDSISDTVSELIDFEIKKQIPKLIQTNSADFEAINDSDISTKVTQDSGDTISVEWLAKAALITQEDVEQAQLNTPNNVADNIFNEYLSPNTKRLAKAHKLLLNILSNELESFGVPKAVKLTTDLFDEPNLKPSFELIPIILWKEKKAVPHYDHNALNLGEADQAYVELSRANSHHHLSKSDRPKDHRFWITNIVIDEEPFQQWYIPQAAKYFKTPTNASMSFEKKYVIINFGEDKNVKVKLLEGFQVIRVLIEQAQMSSNNNSGIAPELLQSISKKLIKGISAEDIHNILPEKLDEFDNRGHLIDCDESDHFDFYESSQSTDDKTIGTAQKQPDLKVRVQKAKSKLRREINKYFTIQSSKKGPRKRQREVIELANKSLMIVEPKYKNDPTLSALLLMRKGARRDGVLDNFLPHTHEDDDASGNTERKKIQNSLWKTMKDALESIKYNCPHFYFHMRETGAKSAKGAMRLHSGVNLIYKPEPENNIKWTFG